MKEKIYLHNMTGYDNADIYISTVFIAVAGFLLATGGGAPRNAVMKAIARWGNKYTLGIYILHPIIMDVIQMVFGPLFRNYSSASKIYYYTAPLVILLFTTALVWALKAAQKQITALIRKK